MVFEIFNWLNLDLEIVIFFRILKQKNILVELGKCQLSLIITVKIQILYGTENGSNKAIFN